MAVSNTMSAKKENMVEEWKLDIGWSEKIKFELEDLMAGRNWVSKNLQGKHPRQK